MNIALKLTQLENDKLIETRTMSLTVCSVQCNWMAQSSMTGHNFEALDNQVTIRLTCYCGPNG